MTRFRGWIRILAWTVALGPAVAQGQNHGQWGPVVSANLTPVVPGEPTEAMLVVHAILLRDGRVLCVDFLGSHPNQNRPDAAIFDPADGTLRLVWESGPSNTPVPPYPGLPPGNGSHHLLYCSGHAATANGEIVFRGGDDNGPGNFLTTIYDPAMGSVGGFKAGPIERWCLEPSNCPGSLTETKRWYPTLTTLGDGSILVSDGHSNSTFPADGNPNTPCLLKTVNSDPIQWEWNPLHNARYCCDIGGSPCNCDPNPPNVFDFDTYPFVFLASSGKLFFGGSQYSPFNDPPPAYTASRILDAGFEQWAQEIASPVRGSSAVMFAQDKVLKSGGGTNFQPASCTPGVISSNLAAVIDLAAPSLAWAPAAPMNQSRFISTLVTLADGRVLTVGGSWEGTNGQPCDATNARLHPELYDPILDTWTLLTTTDTIEPRMRHHTALLLPDGSVFVAGGQQTVPTPFGYRNYQIYKPPYFFGGLPGENLPPRPTISDAPAEILYGKTFDVLTPDASAVTKVRLLRTGAVTHSFDQNARCLELEFSVWTPAPNPTLRIKSPQHAALAPPGYYMLVIGTGPYGRSPSIARMVKVK